MSVDAQLCEVGAQHFVELQHWFAKPVMCDADAMEGDRVAHAAADRLGEGFLGRETLGEHPGRNGVLIKFGQFAFA